MDVVIGYSPFADVSVVLGPFRSPETTLAATEHLQHCGYATEVCPLLRIEDVVPITGAEDDD
jgi:hypothetical protein